MPVKARVLYPGHMSVQRRYYLIKALGMVAQNILFVGFDFKAQHPLGISGLVSGVIQALYLSDLIEGDGLHSLLVADHQASVGYRGAGHITAVCLHMLAGL